jgi:hypothetical protein
MNRRLITFLATTVLLSSVAFSQNPITADSPFQVRYATNMGAAGAKINITNTGASGGNICVNVYAFAPDEQLISCCTCNITPDGLSSIGVRASLTNDTLTGVVPTSVVIKLVASSGSACNAAVVNNLASGMLAWGTTTHILPVTPGSPATTFGVTETAFSPSTLSATELSRITALCGFIQTDGSGAGICGGCTLGGQ